MKLRDVMNKNAITVTPEATALVVAKKIRDANIHSVMITEGDKLVGMITDRELVLKVMAEGKNPVEVRVGEIMVTDVITVEPDVPIIDVAKLMEKHSLVRLPVVDKDSRVVGMVSIVDLPVIAATTASGWRQI